MLRNTVRFLTPFASLGSTRDVLQMLSVDVSNGVHTRDAFKRFVELDVDESSSKAAYEFKNKDRTGISVLQAAMQCHKSEVEICEMGARCLANICLLSQGTESEAAAEVAEAGCVEVILTLGDRVEHLSEKGLVWVATFLQNVTMLSNEAAKRLLAWGDSVSPFLEEAVRRERTPLTVMAAEALVATLARVLAMQRSENNAQGEFYHYESVSFSAITALVKACTMSKGLEFRHKTWEALRIISSHEPNVLLIGKAFGESNATGFGELVNDFIDFLRNGPEPEVAAMMKAGFLDATVPHKLECAALTSMAHLLSQKSLQDGEAVEQMNAVRGPLVAGTLSSELTSRLVADTGAISSQGLSPQRREALLCDLSLMANLVDGDAYTIGANCAAVVHGLSTALVQAAAKATPTPKEGADESAPTPSTSGDATALPMEFLSLAFLRIGTYIWNLLNHVEGIAVVKELNFLELIDAVLPKLGNNEFAAKLQEKLRSLVTEPRFVQ